MARIRTIKPELFQSYTIKRLSLEARWTFVGLLTHVDDDGYCRDEPRIVKGAIWPLEDDVTWSAVAGHIEELIHSGLICRFHHNGVPHIHVVTFRGHQKINRATKSRLPHCPNHTGSDPSVTTESKPEPTVHALLTEDSVSPHAPLTEGSSTEVEVEVEVERELEREVDPAATPEPDNRTAADEPAAAAAAAPHADFGIAPVWAVPLIDQITAEGFVVTWDLGFTDWDAIRVAIDRSGIPAMIHYARQRHQASNIAAYSARAWLKGWKSLPVLDAGSALPSPAQPAADVVTLPAQRPSTADQRVAQARAAAARVAAQVRAQGA